MLGLGTLSCYVAAIFYAGYAHVFLQFCKVFESGGIGKNGSTIAVSSKKKKKSSKTDQTEKRKFDRSHSILKN